MNNYLLILKLVLKNQYRRSKIKNKKERKKDTANWIVVAVGMTPLLAIICFLTFAMTGYLAQDNMHHEVLSVIFSASQITILLFGTQAVISNLYMSRDNEFLQQLPVSHKTVFYVKLTDVYLGELLLSSIMLIPSVITFIAACAVIGVSLPVYFYLLIPLAILASPVIQLLIITVLSFPLVKLITALKNKNVLKLVISTLAFLLFFTAYLIIVPALGKNMTENGVIISDAIINGIMSFSKAFYYNRVLALALCGVDFFKNFFIYMLILIGCAAVVYFLTIWLYDKAVQKQLETSVVKKDTKIEFSSNTAKNALFKREFKNLINDTGFAFNSFMNVFMAPLLISAMSFMGMRADGGMSVSEDGEIVSALATEMSSVGFLLFYGIMILAGMSYTATLAVTREGKTFYINKFLPVEPSAIINAKLKLANITSFVGIVLSAIAAIAFMKVGVFNAIMFVVVMFLICSGFNELGLYRDLKKPNLNWNSVQEAVKKNIYPTVPMFYGMAIGISLMFLCSAGTSILERFMSAWGIRAVVWGLAFVIGAVIKYFNHQRIKRDAVKLFNNINDL